jgi:filamentous hemagglutinin family protein
MKRESKSLKRAVTTRRIPSAFLLRPVAYCVMVAFCDHAAANPTAPQVVSGSAHFQGLGTSSLKVTNSPNAIINWQGFSIPGASVTQFVQQSASSAVLNRVIGADISQIQGQLLSNGRVFLINPAGIVIGANAVIDTAAFVGSTLNMLDADFLAGRLRFSGDGKSGSIVNQGWIKAGSGGNVILVAPNIENSGVIETKGGHILLAAGQKLTIASLDHEGVQFEIQAPGDTAINIGKLLADGGAVGVFAGTLKHSGDIRANAITRDESGQIVLKAQGDIAIAAGSTTRADGPAGGAVTIHSTNGTTLVSGELSAQGSGERGGVVQVLGNYVGLMNGSRVNASGETGGGTVLIGGDYRGTNPLIQNATRTLVDRDASIRADAVTSGDGGKVVVWGDDATRYTGTINARGGAQSGDGGFVEVSGKRVLQFGGNVDTRAPKGEAGTLLLDPTTISIVAGVAVAPLTESTSGCGSPDIYQEATIPPDASSFILIGDLLSTLQNNNVNITTASTAAGAGDINFNTPLNFTATTFGAARTLTLTANRDININNAITRTGAAGEVLNINTTTLSGATKISADISLNGGTFNATSTTSTRNVEINGSSNITAGAFNVGTFASTAFPGTLTINGGTSVFSGPVTILGTLVSNGGTVDFGGTTTLNAANGVDALTISGGTVRFNAASTLNGNGSMSSGTLGGSGTLTIDDNDTFTWSGGDLSGTGTLLLDNPDFPGVLNITGSTSRSMLNGYRISNDDSVINWTATGTVSGTGSTIELLQGAVLTRSGAGTTSTFTGTLNNAAVCTSPTICGVNVTSGTLNLGGGGTDTGPYLIASNAVLELSGGTRNFNVGSVLTNQGTLDVTGGQNSFNGVFTNSGALNITGGVTNTINGTLTNSGTINIGAAQTLTVANGFTNNGTIELTANAGGNVGQLNVNAGTLTNASTLRSSGTGIAANVVNAALTNTGTIDVDHALSITNNARVFDSSNGTLDILAGQTLTVNGGTTRLGAGTAFIGTGTLNLAGTQTLDLASNLTLPPNSVVLDLSGTVTIDSTVPRTLTNAGVLALSGDTVNANVALANQGTLNVTGGLTNTVNGTLTNSGTINIGAAQTLTVANGFTNNGTIELTANAGGNVGQLNVNAGTLTNASTLRSSGTGIAANVVNAALTNTGTIDVQHSLQLNNFATNDGAVQIAATKSLFTNGNSLVNSPAGVIIGAGSVNLGAGTLTNNGTLTPGVPSGDTTGTLTITGNLTQGSNSQLNIELGGTASGDFDVLSVNGTANLGGTLNVSTVGSYVPAVNDAFRIVSAASRTGNFPNANLSLPVDVTAAYDVNGLTLNVATGNVINWVAAGDGTWTQTGNWDRLRAPRSTDTVVISPSVANATITMPAGTYTVGAVDSDANLQVNNATLSVANASTVNGTLALNTSTLAGTGSMDVNALSLSGATLSNTGGVTVLGTTVVSGAPNQVSGSLSTTVLNMAASSLSVTGTVTTGAGISTITGSSLANAGTFKVASGGSVVMNGSTLTNTGAIQVLDGSMQVNGGFPTNAGTLQVDTGTTFATGGNALTNAGVVKGTGTIDLSGATLTNSGTVSPGASPGTLVINGNFTQTPAGTLNIELGGVQQGITYDLLQVTGTATLDGTLAVSTVNGFAPAAGNAFDFMTYASRIGDFSTITGPAELVPGAGGTFYSIFVPVALSPFAAFVNGINPVLTEEQRVIEETLPRVVIEEPDFRLRRTQECT